MSPLRRAALAWALAPSAWAAAAVSTSDTLADDDTVSPRRTLRFPRDHGAHPGAGIEWWYATGWLATSAAGGAGSAQDLVGFQLTFFRSRTGLALTLPGRLAPRQLLFGHAALTWPARGGHRHAQRHARWSGEAPAGGVATAAGPQASTRDTRLRLGPWQLDRGADGAYTARLAAPETGFTLVLRMAPTQPLLLQGEAGWSLKAPPAHASHYYSQPQLDTQARVTVDGRESTLQGRAWLDHEWSDGLMPPQAVGWDWIGINLADGGALMAFVLRTADGRAVHAGGSHRPAGGAVRAFAAGEVAFEPLRQWTSPATGAHYPVRWRIDTPVGRFELEALLDAQELDSRGSTGAVYWEGLSELRDTAGRRVGLGYLEMTGRGSALRLG
ncbi:lipocalin-like domain-containing protein [Ideonella sp. A 288]|uniref:lipocalin-like domain-containing protein n=1 Tax=Ideonella sp. A 288 TaxID=1962181 RepID=UPI000B4B6D9A|nr:lipocalin-like domain-containing protein [Ideonella sp. A 288]